MTDRITVYGVVTRSGRLTTELSTSRQVAERFIEHHGLKGHGYTVQEYTATPRSGQAHHATKS